MKGLPIRGNEKEIAQAALLVSSLHPAGRGVRFLSKNPQVVYRAWQGGMWLLKKAAFIGPILPAIGSESKVGVRWGGTGEYVHLRDHVMFRRTSMAQLPSTGRLNVPDFGWGLTAVPNTEQRFRTPSSLSQSRGVQVHTSTTRMGHQQGRTSPSRPSAPSRRPSSGGSSRTRANNPSVMKRRNARFSGRRPKWCPKHRKHDWCHAQA